MLGNYLEKVGETAENQKSFTTFRCCKDEDSDISPLFGIFTQPNSKTTLSPLKNGFYKKSREAYLRVWSLRLKIAMRHCSRQYHNYHTLLVMNG